MAVNVKKKPTDFVVFDFFGHNFRQPLPPPFPITIAGPLNLQYCVFIKHFWKFLNSKMLDEDTNSRVLRLRRGKLGDENRSQKNQTDVFDFFSHDFRHPIFPHRIRRISSNSRYCLRRTFLRILNYQNCWWGNWVTKITAEEIENIGLLFRLQFSPPNHRHTPPPLSQSSQDSRWVMKIAPQKSKKLVRFFWPFDFLGTIFTTTPLPIAIIAGPSNSRF